MIDAIKQLQNALAYGKFEDNEIKDAAEALLTEMDTELTAENYEPGTATEEAVNRLHDSIEATDSEKEERVAQEKAQIEEDSADQFAGLGDEDEG